MILTINTDASFNCQYGLGAYCFYLKSDNLKIIKSGLLKKPVNNNLAEIQAILNALLFVSKLDFGFDKIILNTDSTYAINFFSLKFTPTLGRQRVEYSEEWNFFRTIRKTLARKSKQTKTLEIFDFRKVKAHQTGENLDARSWVNNLCDIEAKKVIKKHLATK